MSWILKWKDKQMEELQEENNKLKEQNKELIEVVWGKWCNLSISEFDEYLHELLQKTKNK